MRVYDVSGSASADANWSYQVQNANGPTDLAMVPLSASKSYGIPLRVCGGFEHRSCATGIVGWFCTSWAWSQVSAVLQDTGTVVWS
jgi:hypothetical protein